MLHEIHDIGLADHGSVDPDPLAEIDQVRRGEQADPIAGSLQRSRQEVADRSFAIGTGHMQGPVGPVREIQVLVQSNGGA